LKKLKLLSRSILKIEESERYFELKLTFSEERGKEESLEKSIKVLNVEKMGVARRQSFEYS
jgi:hypothetical protein